MVRPSCAQCPPNICLALYCRHKREIFYCTCASRSWTHSNLPICNFTLVHYKHRQREAKSPPSQQKRERLGYTEWAHVSMKDWLQSQQKREKLGCTNWACVSMKDWLQSRLKRERLGYTKWACVSMVSSSLHHCLASADLYLLLVRALKLRFALLQALQETS